VIEWFLLRGLLMLCELGYAILARLKQDKDAVDELQDAYRDKIRGESYIQERDRLDRLLVKDLQEITEHRESCLECGGKQG
jgi:hypothetical protein